MDTITRAFPRDITSWIVACFLVITGSIWWHQARQARSQASSRPDWSSFSDSTATGVKAVEMGDVRVSKILVHPIKSCRGTSVPEVRYSPEGLENDRKWCIIDAKTKGVITAREIPRLVLVEPRLQYDSSSPYRGNLLINVPTETGATTITLPIYPTPDVLKTWPIIDECTMWASKMDAYICQSLVPGAPSPSDVLSRYTGKSVYLAMKGPTPRPCQPTTAFPSLQSTAVFQDGYPVLVASEESLAAVSSAIQHAAKIGPDEPGKIGAMDRERWKDGKIEIERFRPNIVVRGAGAPFCEDKWQRIAITPQPVGQNPRIDPSLTITLVSRCARCLLPNVDPQTGVRDAAVPYKVISKFRTGVDPAHAKTPCFGANGVPGGNGVVRVGDYVFVQELAPPGV